MIALAAPDVRSLLAARRPLGVHLVLVLPNASSPAAERHVRVSGAIVGDFCPAVTVNLLAEIVLHPSRRQGWSVVLA